MGIATLNIGFINSTIREDWAQAQWRGFLEGVHEKGVASYSFIGGVLDSPYGFERQSNTIYRQVGERRLDGLVVWSGGINWYVDEAKMLEFLGGFGTLPIVSIEAAYQGIPSIVMDDYAGMKAAVNHLIEEHRRRRIVFIRGPSGHIGMQKRYQAYLDALSEHAIAFDPALVSEPSGALDSAAFFRSLKMAGLAFDALVAANDDRAREAMGQIRAETNLSIPRDVSVVGFDDSPWCTVTDPPLSTVHTPFSEVGTKAVETLQDILQGKSVPPVQSFVPSFLPRQSCGCGLAVVENFAASHHFSGTHSDRSKSGTFKHRVQSIDSLLQAVVRHPEENHGRSLTNSLRKDAASGGSRNFLTALETALRDSRDLASDYLAFHDILTALETNYRRGIRLPFAKTRAASLLNMARITVNEMSVRRSSLAYIRGQQAQATLSSVSQGVVANFNMTEMLENIRRELPRMGITKFYLLTYDGADSGKAKVLVSSSAGKAQMGEVVEKGMILGDTTIEQCLINDFLVLPLTFETEEIGYIVFEADLGLTANFEGLAAQLASALKGAFLVSQVSNHDRLVSEGVNGLTGSIEALSMNIDSIDASMVNQATSVVEQASAIEELVRNIESINQFSDKSQDFSGQLKSFAEETGVAVRNTIELIHDVETKSAKITELMSLIKDVAEKTHILSLNAAIQATKAGHSGKAFSVVASEIRKLSLDTGISIDSIDSQINLIMNSIKTLTENANLIQRGLVSLETMAEQNADSSVQLGVAISEQTSGSKEIQVSATDLLKITEEVKRSIVEQKAATHEINSSINLLRNIH